jgi:hypothetical protein
LTASSPAGVDAQVEQRAVLAQPAGGERDLAAARHVLEHRVVLGFELLRDERQVQADDFGRLPAEHALRRRVPQRDGPVCAESDDRVRGALDNRARGSVNPLPVAAASHRQPKGHDP